MNKTEKRQSDLRNKLVAAVAMLLVSCIMMVSTTYAWFTLSTAPEIQGITTTVGANGNLEIALSPYSGNAADITSAMGDANKTWAEKNTTWGNLINLSDNSVYGLEDIALLPSRLNANAGANSTVVVNDAAPLSTPTYGADGRPQALNANTRFGTKLDEKDGKIGASTDFIVNDYKGIRVIGTSANMSEFEVTFNSALSDLAAAISSAKTNAQNSLNNNGGALTGMAIQHGLVDGEDKNNYKEYVAGLNNVLTDLDKANAALAEAIKAAVLAEAASSKSNAEKYNAAVAALSGNATIANVQTYLAQYPLTTDNDIATNIASAVAKYTSNQSVISEATGKLNEIKSKDSVSWSDVSEVLTPLMNTSKIKINGLDMDAFKAQGTGGIGNSVLTNGGLNITMESGSGLYADFGAVVGNLEATVIINDFEYDGQPFTGVKSYMKTDSEVAAGGYMPAVRTAIALVGVLVVEDAGSDAVINVPYAYAVDFMFRTNAANSKLMLQTSPAQRVYEESVSSATQGSGSTMTFAVDKNVLSADSTLNLMKSLRVVFMDTATGTIYGIAKIDTAAYDDASAEVIAGLKEIEGDLYLHSYTLETDGRISLGTRIAEDQANLCDLPQNTAKAITALVYLDGDNVTNADVANGVTSMMGAMNLQFSSSAELVPMENTALKEMEGEGEYKVTVDVNNGIHKESKTVTAGAPFEYTIPATILDAYNVESVVVTMGGKVVDNAWNGSKISIPAVDGAIVITVTATAK